MFSLDDKTIRTAFIADLSLEIVALENPALFEEAGIRAKEIADKLKPKDIQKMFQKKLQTSAVAMMSMSEGKVERPKVLIDSLKEMGLWKDKA